MLSQQTIDIVKSTVPVLEQHGTTITTVFYKNMFAAHPELLNVFNHANQERGRQQTALANVVLAAAKHIDNLGAILPAVDTINHKHVSLGIKPEQYPIVGEYLLGAIKEVLGDAATDEIINAWAEAYGEIADIFISLEEGMYKKAEENGGWRFFKDFTVVNKVKESDLITSFYFKPVDGKKLAEYKPGQYISVRVKVPGDEYTLIRQYSLSQSPNSDEFRISIKRENEHEPAGKVSVYLHNHVEVGDKVEISAPAGNFILDPEQSTPVTFLSGGVGITPMMSMFETVAKSNPSRPVSFIHGTRNPNVQAFDKQISKLTDQMDNATYHVLYSDDENGIITKDFLDKNALKGDVYICGPVKFMEIMVNNLLSLGFIEEQVHFEFFGPAMHIGSTPEEAASKK